MKTHIQQKHGRPQELHGRVKLTITLDRKTNRIAIRLAEKQNESRSSLIRRLLKQQLD